MNSKDFTTELAERLGYTTKDATQLVASLVDIMTRELEEDKMVSIPSFGIFEIKKKMERVVVNPVNQQRMLIPPKLILNFRPHISLKEKFKRMNADE